MSEPEPLRLPEQAMPIARTVAGYDAPRPEVPDAMRPQDVPSELVEAMLEAANHACIEMPRFEARRILAAVLPVHERQVMTRLFGTREEVAAREAEAAQRAPDDTVRLCEMARPGEHERRVRERVAAEIEAERSGGTEHWSIAMDHAARIARGESR